MVTPKPDPGPERLGTDGEGQEVGSSSRGAPKRDVQVRQAKQVRDGTIVHGVKARVWGVATPATMFSVAQSIAKADSAVSYGRPHAGPRTRTPAWAMAGRTKMWAENLPSVSRPRQNGAVQGSSSRGAPQCDVQVRQVQQVRVPRVRQVRGRPPAGRARQWRTTARIAEAGERARHFHLMQSRLVSLPPVRARAAQCSAPGQGRPRRHPWR